MWIRTGEPTTADADTGASDSTSISMFVDKVGGVPVSGSSLAAVLVGGKVFVGSVGVAATCSVDSGAVGVEVESSDEHPTASTDARTNGAMKRGKDFRIIGPFCQPNPGESVTT